MNEPAARQPTAPAFRGGGLLVAALIVAFGFVGSRLLGVVRTVAIADAFGSDPELGAYNVAFRVPDLIFQVLAGATLGSAFIPVFARLWAREGEDRAWRLASTMINAVTAGTAVLCVLGFLLAPVLVPALAPGLGEDIGRRDELVAQAVDLTRLMLLSPLLFSISGMVTGILNARERFLLPALAPIIYNLSIIFGAVVLSRPWGVEGLAVGVVAGAALHLAVQVPGLLRERMRYRAILDLRDRAARDVARLMGPRAVGLAAAQLNFVVTTYFASRVGTAEISDINYAWLVAQLPLAIFGMAISTAVFPRLATQVARDEYEEMLAMLSRALRVIMFLSIPAAIGLAMLAAPAVTVLLERGEFTARDTAITSAALAWFCLGIVPQAGIEIHSRGFYAVGDTLTPVIFAVGAVGLNLALSALLFAEFEVEGLAFAVSVASWVEWVALYFAFCVRTRASAGADLRAMATMTLAAAMMALSLALTVARLDPDSRAESAVLAIGGGLAGALLYLGFAILFRIGALADVAGPLLQRLGIGKALRSEAQ